MAADGVVKTPGDQQTLFGSGVSAKRRPHQTGDFGKDRPHVIGGARRPEDSSPVPALAHRGGGGPLSRAHESAAISPAPARDAPSATTAAVRNPVAAAGTSAANV